MNVIWESANEAAKVVDCGDRYTVVLWSNGTTRLVSEYWKDGSEQVALYEAIDQAASVARTVERSRTLLG